MWRGARPVWASGVAALGRGWSRGAAVSRRSPASRTRHSRLTPPRGRKKSICTLLPMINLPYRRYKIHHAHTHINSCFAARNPIAHTTRDSGLGLGEEYARTEDRRDTRHLSSPMHHVPSFHPAREVGVRSKRSHWPLSMLHMRGRVVRTRPPVAATVATTLATTQTGYAHTDRPLEPTDILPTFTALP